MRILHLAAGAGSMYCGACTRDVALIRGLVARGHDVHVVPLYTPLRLEEGPALPTTPLFVGGINAYLQQVSRVFRHTPDWLDRLLDSPGLLRWASRFAVTVRPQDLGPMTVSMLNGRGGRQRKELDRLLRFLDGEPRPDVVSITNSLLSGIAPDLKRHLGAPVVCGLQGEDSFVQAIPEPHRSMARERMRRNAESVDLFVATGRDHAATMAEHLQLPPSRIRVVRAGIDVEPYVGRAPQPSGPLTIGYLGAIHRPKGLDLLMEAFRVLVRDAGLDVRLSIAGRILDHRYWQAVQAKAHEHAFTERLEYHGEVTLAGKVAFLHRCKVFVSPSRIPEARGMAALEAMAAGVPVIAPHSGVFPEMMELTGGGMLFESEDPGDMAAAIARMLRNPDTRADLGRRAADGVHAHYSAAEMVDRALDMYSSVADREVTATALGE